MKNKTLKIVLGVVVIIAAAGAGYVYFSGTETNQIVVETLTTQKGSVTKTITATGTVQPITQVEVGTQVSGVVEKIYVDYNSQVKAGQLLAELDKVNLEAALLQAQANYDNAVNDRDYLQGVHDRQKTLFDSQVLSQSDYDQALYNLKNAKSTVVQRGSALQTAKTNLGYAKIYSPIDGVVLSKDVDEGQTVAASYSTPTLFTIAQDLKQMQVEADVDEADIGQVSDGQRVSFTVDAYQGEEFAGVVTQVRLNPTTTSNVVTYTVVIRAENPDLKLKPGLTATISIYTMELKDVLTIQSKAVNFQPNMELMKAYAEQNGIERERPKRPSTEDGEPNAEEPKREASEKGKMAWVMNGEELKPTRIELGESDGINVQVISGLNEGDKVVYSMKSASGETTVAATSGDNSSPFMPQRP
ncbi:MAG: efflux RND transporter periplasmic adaptor subunit [Flavobacteriales bacterium]|nr:efflux RND transporter periplasmic adaptor subunit [Flavobacteriales bacterium]